MLHLEIKLKSLWICHNSCSSYYRIKLGGIARLVRGKVLQEKENEYFWQQNQLVHPHIKLF